MQEILEVAMGLIFMWLVMSIAAMQFQEWIATLLKWRARDLEKAIFNMMGNELFVDKLYNMPLIASLAKAASQTEAKSYDKHPNRVKKGLFDLLIGIRSIIQWLNRAVGALLWPVRVLIGFEERSLPSYIGAQQFSKALFEMLITAGTEESVIKNKVDNLFGGWLKPALTELTSEQKRFDKKDWETVTQTIQKVITSQSGDEAVEQIINDIEKFVDEKPNLKELKSYIDWETVAQTIQQVLASQSGDNALKQITGKIKELFEKTKPEALKPYKDWGTVTQAIQQIIASQPAEAAVQQIKTTIDEFFKNYPNLIKPKELNTYLAKLPTEKDLRQGITDLIAINAIFKDLQDTFNGILDLIKSPSQVREAKTQLEDILTTAKNAFKTEPPDMVMARLKTQINVLAQKYLDFKQNPDVKSLVEQVVTNVDKDLTLRQLRLGLLALNAINPQTAQKLQKSMNSLLNGLEESVAKGEQAIGLVRTNVENWYDSAMDRLIGQYKRKAQLVSFLIGLVLALILNVDSLQIATRMWNEPTLRQAIVQQAQWYVEKNPQGPSVSQQTGTSGSETITATQTVSPTVAIANLRNALESLKVPFGWEVASVQVSATVSCSLVPLGSNIVWGYEQHQADNQNYCKQIVNLPKGLEGWIGKIVGILMTGAAAAQGAPFWFDVLKKVINVRGAGVNPNEKEQQKK